MSRMKLGGTFLVKCFDSHGNLKWEDKADNIVVNEGLNHILDILFISSTTQVDPWYVGLTDSSPVVDATDTLSSATWSEITDYTGDRKEFVDARTDQQVNNDGNEAIFNIDNTATVGGAFLSSVSTGTTGTLLCVAAFNGGDKSVANGDTVEVEYQFNAFDDGV